MKSHARTRFQILPASGFLCVLLLAGAGCRSIGPGTVQRDRMHYASAVAESWKEQLLLNIVKTRYADPPAFLEVSSLVAGYSLETGLGAKGQYSPPSLSGDSFVGGDISGKFTDRPTISYSPMTGERFARSLMSPTPLDALWSVIQGGQPVDFLLGLTLHSFEGYHNSGIYGGQYVPIDPEFGELLQLMRALQRARATESKLLKSADHTEVWIQFRSADDTRTNAAPELARLKELLRVPAETNQIKVVFDTCSPQPGVVGMRTRSLMQILGTLGAGVQIPSEHLAGGGVVRVDAAQLPTVFAVRSGKEKPKQPFVSVPYRGHWFWIEETDLPTKTTLAAVTILFNFLEGGGAKAAPVLTIPAN